MTISSEAMASKQDATGRQQTVHGLGKSVSRHRFSDIWKAPLHDFPVREEILKQFVCFSPGMAVLEIGPGSGFTAYWMSRLVRRITLLDFAAETIADLSRQFCRIANLSFFVADVARPGLASQIEERFDVAFGLDVFESLPDPLASLRNLADVLRPGGELFLTYPNVPPPRGHAVTYFQSRAEIEELLKSAGFQTWQIFEVRLRPFSAKVYWQLHDRPLAFLRSLRAGNQKRRVEAYDKTWAFQQRRQMSRLKIPMHLYWSFLARVICMRGPAFVSKPAASEILGKQIVIRAWK